MKKKIPKLVLFCGYLTIIVNACLLPYHVKLFASKQINLSLFIFFMLYASIYLITGIGLLKLHNLARIYFLFITVVQFANTLYKSIPKLMYSGAIKKVAVFDVCSSIAILVIILYYFNREDIKKVFSAVKNNK